jgi:poly-gamma-glutamate capsule biosynthesis protein CapA/YwtB (metallophosphatase superfamily)
MAAEEAPTVALLGDVMLGRRVAAALAEMPPAECWSTGLRDVLRACDIVVCNLECCVSPRGSRTRRIPGKPFFFRAPPAAVESLRAVGVAVAGLANNHVLDFEEDGLADTLGLLAAAGIATAGAGRAEGEARRGAVVSAAGHRLGVLALADHPREYAAGEAAPGIAWADLPEETPEWARAELGRLRRECDWVLAFPHWGGAMSAGPARWQRARAAELLDAGADLVAGHSAHVFQGVERMAAGTVAYDLGDALDDYAVDGERRNDLGLMALWRPAGEPALELVGLGLDFCHTGLASGADAEWISRRLVTACAELGTACERVDEQRFAMA